MSEEIEKKSKKDAISENEVEKLAAIVNAAVSAAMKEGVETNQNFAKTIAEAIVEARKPYVDPKQKANLESAKRSSRLQAIKQKAVKKAEQEACPHHKGSNPNSFRSDPFDYSIAKIVLDSGEIVGVCTNCTRVFSSLFPEDVPFLRQKSSNQTARAGQRFFDNPLQAQRARLGLDQKEIFADENGNLVDETGALLDAPVAQ